MWALLLANVIEKSYRPHYGPGVDSASIRNEYQESLKIKINLGVKCGRRVGLTTLPPSISSLSK
jgi:hypothetical protein